MSTTWAFHADSGLTMPVTARVVTIADGLGPGDAVIYFGSAVPGRTLQAATGTGESPIVIEIDDSTAPTISATAIKLALSPAGLASAVAGAPLLLPPVLSSGVSGLIAVYVRTIQGVLPLTLHTGIRLRTGPVVES